MPDSKLLEHIVFQDFVRKSPVPMVINSGEGDPRITFLNDRFVSTFGYTIEDIPTVSAWSKSAYPDESYRKKVLTEWERSWTEAKDDQGSTTPREYEVVCKNGSKKIILLSGTIVGDSTLITLIDITEIRSAQESALRKKELETAQQISQIINFDSLTRLPNRELANSLIDNAISVAKSSGKVPALICMDIDDFKVINETFGRSAGDHVLESIARRTQSTLRDGDTVARLSGDEFLLILSDVANQEWLEAYCDQLQTCVSESFTFNDKLIRITVSLGIAMYPLHGENSESLFLNAETALANAKEQGKNIALLFRSGMKAAIDRYAEVIGMLQQALENDEFVLHYQPQIDIDTGLVSGVEALIRWQSPVYGLQYPDTFIPIAERSGLVVPIGTWVLREACKQARHWQQLGLPIGSVSINLSAIQFRRGNAGKVISQILEDTGLTPSMLVLELTESILMHEEDLVMQAIDELRSLGVRLSIDDFGTGYSSMTYLKRFKVDRLKIDKSFVMAMFKSEEDRSIVRYVIDLASSLNITSIAEGVENEETLSMLMSLGCNQAQGYFLSKPVPASGIEAFFDESK